MHPSPVYNTSKFGLDIPPKKFIGLQIGTLKRRNDVVTSLRHRNWSPFLFLRMRLGLIYDPSKFSHDISTNKKVYWFASFVVGEVVVVGVGSSTVFCYILLPGVARFSDCCFNSVGVNFRVGRPCKVIDVIR